MRILRTRRVSVIILGIIGLCGVFYVARHVPAQLALRDSQALWSRQHPMHYRYTFAPSCLCPYDRVQVEVQNGVVTTVARISDGRLEPIAAYKDLAPIEQLFGLIERDLRARVLWVAASYDPVYGYPQRIDVRDRGYGSDDTSAFTVTDFEVLK